MYKVQNTVHIKINIKGHLNKWTNKTYNKNIYIKTTYIKIPFLTYQQKAESLTTDSEGNALRKPTQLHTACVSEDCYNS